MKKEQFIQSSATTRVYEKNLITNTQLNRMIDMKTTQDILNYLSDTVYKESINKLKRKEDYEDILSKELIRVYGLMKNISPDRRIVEFLEQKYVYHNLKTLVKEVIQDEDYSNIYIDIGGLNIIKLKKDLIDNVKREDREYKDLKEAYDLYKNTKNPQIIDISLDKAYFLNLYNRALDMNYEFFIKYIKTRIDFMNIKSLMRAYYQKKDMEFLDNVLIDHGYIKKDEYLSYLQKPLEADSSLFKSSDIYYYVRSAIEAKDINKTMGAFEKTIDNYLTDLIRDKKKDTYGPEIIFSYIVGKETEIKNLRIILTAKENDLPLKFIKERVRNSYV